MALFDALFKSEMFLEVEVGRVLDLVQLSMSEMSENILSHILDKQTLSVAIHLAICQKSCPHLTSHLGGASHGGSPGLRIS